MTPHDAPAILLAKAREDQHVMLLLLNETSVTDAVIGFHAQQAIEKSLKAVLSFYGVHYRRTHDISELLDLMNASSIKYPDSLEKGVELTPFAAELRYDYLPPEATPEIPFDRSRIAELVGAAITWAQAQTQRI